MAAGQKWILKPVHWESAPEISSLGGSRFHFFSDFTVLREVSSVDSTGNKKL